MKMNDLQNSGPDHDGPQGDSAALRLNVNGETRLIEAVSVRALLDALGHESDFIAVAVNHSVIPRARWSEDILRNDDDIEIVSPRQGG